MARNAMTSIFNKLATKRNECHGIASGSHCMARSRSEYKGTGCSLGGIVLQCPKWTNYDK
eukprot:1210916-Amphidinium_carterae.1